MKSIAFVRFLDAKDKLSGKVYVYLVDDDVRNKLVPSPISNTVTAYRITNNSGYNYRGAKVVCIGTQIISDEESYNLMGLKQIITVDYSGEIDYPKSNRIQDIAVAQRDFDRERKKDTKTNTATLSSTSNDGMKAYIKQGNVWQEWLKPVEVSFATDNETLNNSLWKILDSAPSTSKIADVGITSDKLGGNVTSSTVTNAGTIKCNPNTVIGSITCEPWSATGSITTNSSELEKNYLKKSKKLKI